MRLICGLAAAAMLAALAQPASAFCINRGGARTCAPDPKYWSVATGPEQDSSADVKAIVMQPGTPGDDAWVMTPGDTVAVTVPPVVKVDVPACELGISC